MERTINISYNGKSYTIQQDFIDCFNWQSDRENGERIKKSIPNLPKNLATQLARFIRINPEKSESTEKTNRFKLSYFPDEDIWEAVTENITTLDGKRYFLTDKVADFDPKENYQMTL